MSRSRWTSIAQRDLAALHLWYREIRPDYADRVGRAALAASRFLAAHPHAGPLIGDNLRKWRVPRTDYLLVYRCVGADIEVVRLQHARQDWLTS